MTDRPIIFSSAMVRALLEGRKTQTRRLATSPLRHCRPGDRLYVREAFAIGGPSDGSISGADRFWFMADHPGDPAGMGWRPSIHMPRHASRLTLLVTRVRGQRLQDITEADAVDEGAGQAPRAMADSDPGEWLAFTHRGGFACLWSDLHAKPHAWEDNPPIVALTFAVYPHNIDRMPPLA